MSAPSSKREEIRRFLSTHFDDDSIDDVRVLLARDALSQSRSIEIIDDDEQALAETEDLVYRSIDTAQRYGIEPILASNPLFTDRFAALPYHVLWLRGMRHALTTLQGSVAIVGARAATGYGEHVSMELAAGLVGLDRTVISGGAYGIDGMAHRATLASDGTTIAVMAGGLDRLYPSGHEALLTRVAESKGALVSHLLPGAAPTKFRFLQRNAVIAALADAVVVVEAGRRSGALSTAEWGNTLGKPVGAVPGPITSAASSGTHELLRSGAHVVTSAADAAGLADGPRP